MPLVDIIIPAYNPGQFLRETLASVVAQTLADWQAIVVDDGSTEDLAWVDSYDARVRRVRQDNTGLSGARNRGIAEGQSPNVAFLDADDLWLPGKLDAQIVALEQSGAGMCSTAFEIVNETGDVVGRGFEGYARSYKELLQGNGICVSTVVVPRHVLDSVGGFSLDLRQVQDWDLWLRLTKTTAAIKVPTIFAHYRQHESNMSADYTNMLGESRSILRRHQRAAAQRGQRDLAAAARLGQKRVRRLAGTQAFDAFRSAVPEDRLAAARHLGHALRFAPGFTARSIASKAMSSFR